MKNVREKKGEIGSTLNINIKALFSDKDRSYNREILSILVRIDHSIRTKIKIRRMRLWSSIIQLQVNLIQRRRHATAAHLFCKWVIMIIHISELAKYIIGHSTSSVPKSFKIHLVFHILSHTISIILLLKSIQLSLQLGLFFIKVVVHIGITSNLGVDLSLLVIMRKWVIIKHVLTLLNLNPISGWILGGIIIILKMFEIFIKADARTIFVPNTRLKRFIDMTCLFIDTIL